MALERSFSRVSPVMVLKLASGLKVLLANITNKPEEEDKFDKGVVTHICAIFYLHSPEWIF